MKPELKLENVSISAGGRKILSGLSLELLKGFRLLIKGASGSGKSTFLKCLLGFVPFEGRITVKGVPLTPQTSGQCRLFFSYVPQGLDVFSGLLKEELEEVFRAKANRNKALGFGCFLEHLRVLGFENADFSLLEKRWESFSGGEKQRILIAVALTLERDILLFDEPTSALDEELKGRIVDHMRRLEKSLVVVSHDEVWERLDNLKVLELAEGGWRIR
ncbi:MAG: ABC transporter ATP-binding protein [Deferribacteres bacterium]|nr:ABC transporter ATP-binding protein [Deferribacteres bacterium]